MKILTVNLTKILNMPTIINQAHKPAKNALPAQPKNPLHGLTLETLLTALHAHYGWDDLAKRIPINCFTHEPSIKSSLKFLRKTPWAREKVESIYGFMLRDINRANAVSIISD